MADEFELSARITGDTSDLERALERAQNSTEDFAGNVDDLTDNIESGSQNWGFSFDNFYQKGSSIFKDFGFDIDQFASHFGVDGKLLSGIVAVTVALEKLGEKMQAMSSNIVKGTGATGKALQELKDSASDALVLGVGRSTEVIGEMIANLNTRFDLTGESLVKMTDEFDKFAGIAGIDAAGSINSVADVIYKWGLSVDDTTDLMNQLVVASQKSGATVDELLNNVKNGQSVFSQFGMSLTDSIAFEASLAKQGIDASSAILGMRTALAKFAEQGVSAQEGFAKVSEQIKNSKTQTEALNIAIETFGTRSGPEMLRVLSDSSASIDDFKNSMLEAGLAIDETDEASRTVSDAIDDLKAVFTGTFGAFGEGIANIFKSLIDTISAFIQSLSPVIKPIGEIFNAVFTFIGEVIKLFVTNLIQFSTKYSAVFQGISNVLKTFRDFVRKVLQVVLDIFGNVFGMIFAILDGKWSLVWEYAKNSMLKVADAILSAISSLVNAFSGMINAFIDKINILIDKYNELAESEFGKFFGMKKGTKLKPFENLDLSEMSGLTDLIEKSNAKIAELTGKTAEKLTNDLGTVEDSEVDFGLGTVQAFEPAVQTTKDLENSMDKITNSVPNNLDNMANKSKNSLNKFIKNIKSLASTIKNIFINAINLDPDETLNSLLAFEDKVLTFFTTTLPKLPELFASILESVVHLIVTLASNPEFVKTIVSVILKISEILINNFPILLETVLKLSVDLISGIIENIPKLIGMLIKSLPNIIKTLVSAIWDMIKSAFNAIGGWVKKAWNWVGDKLGWWATGVNNAPSGLAVVGEQGPELIDFKGGERVYNAQDTRQILSGANSNSGGNNFNVTFNNVQDTTAFTMIQQLKDFDRQLAINGVL